jgi:outer membrane protein
VLLPCRPPDRVFQTAERPDRRPDARLPTGASDVQTNSNRPTGGVWMTTGKGIGMRLTKALAVMALAIFLASPITATGADAPKIAVVNLQTVLETSVAGKAAQNELKTQRDKLEADLKQKGGELQELEKRLQREAMVMSKETREEKEREFRIKASDFQALQKKYRSDLQDLERRLMGELQKDISELVNDIGKKEGYLLVISNIGVLYHQPTADITSRLIQELNAKPAKKAGK